MGTPKPIVQDGILAASQSPYPPLPSLEPKPLYEWPGTMRADFGEQIITGTHNIHMMDAFTDEGLAALLDSYPRERLGIYRFPPHAEGRVKAEHGCAPDLSGKDLLEAVKNGDLWLNLRAANLYLPEYAEIANTLFTHLEAATDQKTLNQDVGVLISSPNIQVHYHLDIPMVCLIQIRGEKRVHFYPVGAPFADPSVIEAIALREQEEELAFRHDFEAACETISMRPGMAVTWPQTAPHRVENGNMLNVSLSCEFMTLPAILKANALVTNSRLRKMGASPDFPRSAGPITFAKAGAARVIKKLSPLPEKGPTPITFEVTGPNTIKSTVTSAQRSKIHRCEVKSPTELTVKDIQDWEALCASNFQYQNPLLQPGFAKMIGRIRDDVKCVLIHDGDDLVGVLAVHLGQLGHAWPLGAPFCDYAGPVIAKDMDLNLAEILTLSGISTYRSQSAVSLPQTTPDPAFSGPGESYIIHLKGRTPEDYLESRRAEHAKRFKNMRRLMNKIDRETGPLTFHYGPPKPVDIDLLLKWKSEQFQREGFLDLTKAQNSRAIIDAAAKAKAENQSDFQGFMTGLYVDGKLIAGHFGVRSGKMYHPWIAAYDPAFDDYSPGMLLLYSVIEAMTDMGLESYDLSDGHGSYKKYFAERGRDIRAVSATNTDMAGRYHKLKNSGWEILTRRNENSAAARLRRRMNHIAVCEPRLLARVNEFGIALAKRSHVSGVDEN